MTKCAVTSHGEPHRVIKTFNRELIAGKDENVVDALRVSSMFFQVGCCMFNIPRLSDFAVFGEQRAGDE